MTPPADDTPAPHKSAPSADVNADMNEGLPERAELTPELVEETALRNDFMLRLAVVLLALLMGFTAVEDSRLLVHVRTGQHITSEGLPRTDVFSHTAEGRPWVNLSWLFDVLAAGMYLLGDWSLTIFQAAVAAATFYFLIAIRRPGVPTWWGSVCAVLALVVCVPQLTALPESVTLLGTAATLWLLHRWRQSGSTRHLVALPLVMLAWANLDPRAFLGAGLVVLFTVGTFLDDLLGRTEDTDPGTGPLAVAALASLVACLAHPFGWQTWLAPLGLYGVEYPALRAADPLLLGGLTARAETMFSSEYWRPVTPQVVAGAALLLAALVTMILNARRVRLAHALVWLGAAAAAAAARQELAFAAIVSAALATLGAQEWFAANFRQVYSTAPGDRVFSVGGRLVTALAFVGLAFAFLIGVASPDGGRVGVGLSGELRRHAAAVAEDVKGLPREHRGFNFSYREGDFLLWAGQRTFVDSRLQVFATPPAEREQPKPKPEPKQPDQPPANRDDDKAETEDGETEDAESKPAPVLGESVLADHRRMVGAVQAVATGAEDAADLVEVWAAGLDRYEPTHLLIPLLEPYPAYDAYRVLMIGDRRWGLTRLGAALGVAYRRDLPVAAEYLAEHPWRPQEQVFREEVEKLEPRLLGFEWPSRRPWLTRRMNGPLPTPNAIRRAVNYRTHISSIPLDPFSQAVLAHVVIREAHAGLVQQPNHLDGYRQLVNAYRVLDNAERQIIAQVVPRPVPLQRRYYQILAATYQALALAPDDFDLHYSLAELYGRYNRLDLALREVDWLLAHWPQDAANARAKHQRAALKEQREQIARVVDEIRGGVDRRRAQDSPPLLEAARLAQDGRCFLLALELLEEVKAEEIAGNPAAVLLQVEVLTEVGRVPEAYQLMQQSRAQDVFKQVQPNPVADVPWREWVGYLELMMGRYDLAAEAFAQEADRIQEETAEQFLATFPLATRPIEPFPFFGNVGGSWPVWQALIGQKLVHPHAASMMLYNAGLTWLEAGRPEQAGRLFRECLDAAPALVVRPAAALYLQGTSGEPVSRFAPGGFIPIWSGMFDPSPPGTVRAGTDPQPARAEDAP